MTSIDNRQAFWIAAALLASAALSASAGASQLMIQRIPLEPGWNAVYLEVEPVDPDAEAVFDSLPAGLTLESAWTWIGRTSTVQFIQDPSEPRLRESGWLGYFPRPGPEAFLTNLHRVEANRAYLVKLGGSQAASWSVTGRPRFSRPRWTPGSFNLVGMPVDPAAPPTFAAFFAASAAHAGQPIYRLDAAGSWRLAGAGETMAAGEAFWIYTASASDFAGPLDLELRGDGLDFGSRLESLEIEITNRADVARTVEASLLEGAGPIAYRTFEADQGRFVWRALDAGVELSFAADDRLALRLAPIRRDVSGVFEAILELNDGAGSRRLLPLRALAAGTAVEPTGAIEVGGCELGGLWVGTASVEEVSEVPGRDPTTGDVPLAPAVSSVFGQRLLIHVGSLDDGDDCTARLVDEVFQMWLDEGNGGGCPALVTEPALLDGGPDDPPYRGSTLVDGEPVGRRISTVAYHLDQDLEMAGELGGTDGLTVSIQIPGDHRTHPYRHRYHPDHAQRVDDCAQRYGDDGRRAACSWGWESFPTSLVPDCGCAAQYPVDDTDGDFTDERLRGACSDGCARSGQLVREIALGFDAADPAAGDGEPDGPDWRSTRLAGTWSETLLGLHRLPLRTAGTFTLRRVTALETLNPTACP